MCPLSPFRAAGKSYNSFVCNISEHNEKCQSWMIIKNNSRFIFWWSLDGLIDVQCKPSVKLLYYYTMMNYELWTALVWLGIKPSVLTCIGLNGKYTEPRLYQLIYLNLINHVNPDAYFFPRRNINTKYWTMDRQISSCLSAYLFYIHLQ